MKNILLVLLLFSTQFLYAQKPTKIIVRAQAKDAKFIGSSIGGAHIIIRDKTTNEILAQGKTTGSTGDRELIMNTPRERNMRITSESTAKFEAELNLSEPTLVKIEAIAPINQRQAAVTSSTELWLIPEKDILGDGIVLEVSGFIINVVAPRTHQYMTLESLDNGEVSIQANVVMMCGCPIEEGGLWDANDMEVKALLKKEGKLLQEIELKVGKTGLFEGKAKLEENGYYEFTVFAYNSETGNTGVDKVNFVVRD